MPVFDVAMFEKAFYRRINEKFNDTINSTRNSIQWRIYSSISIEIKQM